jgi:hypothetical protein
MEHLEKYLFLRKFNLEFFQRKESILAFRAMPTNNIMDMIISPVEMFT